MILFEKVRWKNFLSTGNQYSEINFQGKSTTLIVGSNGSGKSTVLDALTFSLFAKPFRKINRSQLINTVNEKDLCVEVEFKIGTISWKVIRGVKPNIFEIWRNDKLLDQSASVNDQQKWLEQNVIKMNYKSFTQIVILGSSNFIPFMQLSAPNRREVIEDLLDIKIFTSMNNILKEKIRKVRDEVKTLDLKRDSLNDKVKMQERFIQDVETRGKVDIEQKKKKLEYMKNTLCRLGNNCKNKKCGFSYLAFSNGLALRGFAFLKNDMSKKIRLAISCRMVTKSSRELSSRAHFGQKNIMGSPNRPISHSAPP